MILCIAEKPSVAREIAKVLGANTKRDGYLQSDKYCVTWTFGHLCTLKDPADYNKQWQRWDAYSLPLIPDRFGIKLINESSYKRQFEIIQKLVEEAEMVINCGDAGQEGELIQRWVLQKAGCKVPVKRLWVSSLTNEALMEGFEKLFESSRFENLYFAGLARAMGDWLLGINGTRLYSTLYGEPGLPLSMGRVQTPTLAMIVQRDREIENFVPQTTYEVQTVYRNTLFKQTQEAYATKEEACEQAQALEHSPFTVTKVTQKKGNEFPPSLFDLTSLQVEANKKYKMSADETLKSIQSLYEMKLTTYPRVDTVYLSEDLWDKIPGIMSLLAKQTLYTELVEPLRKKGALKKSKKVFDNNKVTDHHAIIPTGEMPREQLSPSLQRIYDLVTKRFIAAFYPEAKVSTTTVEGKVESFKFKTSGKSILEPGWRVVLKPSDDNDSKEEGNKAAAPEKVLPLFVEGESGPHQPQVKEKTTEPPKHYTEATLLRSMETAGKQVTDEKLREALKENGIGRPSTRAAIIETLFKRQYIVKNKNTLYATDRGKNIIDTIQNPLLKSAELTGQWEHKLRCIERGEYTAELFLQELKQQVMQLVTDERKRAYMLKQKR